MGTFSISESARSEIRRIIEASGCRSPVISLGESGPELEVPPTLKAAILRGVSDSEFGEMKQLVEKQFIEKRELATITVGAYERAECRSEDLIEVGEFTLAMTVPMREALSAYCLTYTGGQFMLESADEVVASIRSVKTLAEWFK